MWKLRALLVTLHVCSVGGRFGQNKVTPLRATRKQTLLLKKLLLQKDVISSSLPASRSVGIALQYMNERNMLVWPTIESALGQTLATPKPSAVAKNESGTEQLSDFDLNKVTALSMLSSTELIKFSRVPKDYPRFATDLDNFLAANRWWLVDQEPFPFQPKEQQVPLILRRIPWKDGEKWLKWFTARQYWGAQECSEMMMALFCDPSAWGAFQHLAADAFRKSIAKGAIFDVYQKFRHGHEIGWWKVSTDYCPHTRWAMSIPFTSV